MEKLLVKKKVEPGSTWSLPNSRQARRASGTREASLLTGTPERLGWLDAAIAFFKRLGQIMPGQLQE